MKTKILNLAVAAMILFTGCKKGDSNNSTTGIKYQLTTTNRTSVIARTDAGAIQWASGFGSATEIKFEAKNGSKEIEQKSEVAQKVDLFSAISTLGNVNLAAGTYTEVEFKVELNPSGNDAALELNGQLVSSGVTIPVTFRVTSPFEIKNEKDNVVVTDNSSFKALTTIDLSLITNGVTQSMLNNAVQTNGTILITSTINADIYNIILNNLHNSDEVEFEHD